LEALKMDDIIVDVTIRITLKKDSGENLNDILDEMDYDIQDTTGKADIIDTEYTEYEVISAK